MMWLVAFAVVVAGACGAVARYFVGLWSAELHTFPWAVLIVNSAGSAIAGWMLALTVTESVSFTVSVVVLTGLCGGLTTFSTFSVETIQLMLDGNQRLAVMNILLNFAIGLAAAVAAFELTFWVVSGS
ncbi:MAG: fluoride efflux transporter CrcB [Microbacteriaceae bacterium]